MKRICLYGASSATLAETYYAAAHTIGEGLAASGIGLVFGGGATGTLEEFFEIFTLRQLGRHQKPIYILNTCGYFDQLLAFLEHMVSEKFMRQHCLDMIHVYDDPETLIEALQEA